MAPARIIIVGLAIIIMLIIAVQNTNAVDATILFFSTTMPLTVLIAISFALGTVFGLALALGLVRPRRAPAPVENP